MANELQVSVIQRSARRVVPTTMDTARGAVPRGGRSTRRHVDALSKSAFARVVAICGISFARIAYGDGGVLYEGQDVRISYDATTVEQGFCDVNDQAASPEHARYDRAPLRVVRV